MSTSFFSSLRARILLSGVLLLGAVVNLTTFALGHAKTQGSGSLLEQQEMQVYLSAGLVTLVVFYLVWLFWNVARSLKQASDCLGLAGKGDLNSRLLHIKGTGEVAALQHSINLLLDITEAFLKESEASLAAAGQRRYYRKFIATGMPGVFGKSAIAISNIMSMMHKKDQDYETTLKDMIDHFDANITKFLTDLFSAGENLQHIANELNSLSVLSIEQSGELSRASEVSSSSVGVVVSTTEELSASIREINTQVTRASNVSEEAVRKSHDASKAIANLQDGANKIGDIVHFIGDIADQTNLLALNATIEAARAGDAGKGFAVVAAEVKGLATKTGEATTEISSHVSNLLKAIESTVSVISDIARVIQNISESSNSISAAMEEQEAGVNEILRSMQSAATSVQQAQEATEAVNTTANSTGEMAKELADAAQSLSQKGSVIAGELDVFLSNLKTQ
jgi:methyl-accepting chemotaxis protein